MNILVVCQRYWPEQFQITDICEGLVTRGHDVTVLCGLPNVGIPEGVPGAVLPEYRHGRNRKQEHNGVRIIRSLEVGRRSGIIWRAANYYSFWKSAKHMIKRFERRYDVVFAYQLSPAMMGMPAVAYKEKFDVPALLYCCDLWPESMKAVLGDTGNAIVNHFGKICRLMYEKCDRIAIQSPAFMDYFINYHHISSEKIFYLPQFSTDGSGEPALLASHDGVNVTFMGNMGTVQGIPTMLEAIRLLPKELNIRLLLVGDGSVVPEAKKFVQEHGLESRVIFCGRHPATEMPRFYAITDICVLCLDDSSLIGLTVPSKLQGYMAAGRPIVAAATGGAKSVIEAAHCGIVVGPGDAAAMADAVKEIAMNPLLQSEYGANAREYSQLHFTKESFLDNLEKELFNLTVQR